MCETYAAVQTQSYSMGIFCQTHFFCEVAKALCMMTKARSVEDNEGNGMGMLSPLDRNASPCPGHNAQFSPGPRREKTCHSEIPGDALCEPFIISLSHVCLLAYSRLSDAQSRGCGREPSVRFKSNESHPLICRVA